MINTKFSARSGLLLVLYDLLQCNGGIVATVHSGFFEEVVYGVRTELLEVLKGIDSVFDASNNNLAVVVNQPCLLLLSGVNPSGFVLVDVDPHTPLGHPSLMLWMEDFPNHTLSAYIWLIFTRTVTPLEIFRWFPQIVYTTRLCEANKCRIFKPFFLFI